MRLFEHSKNVIVDMFIECIKSNNIPTDEHISVSIIDNGCGTSIGLIYFESFVKEILDDIIETIDVEIHYLPKYIDTKLESNHGEDYCIEYYPIILPYPRKTYGVWQRNKNIQHFDKEEKLSHYSNIPHKVFNNSHGSLLYLKIYFKRFRF